MRQPTLHARIEQHSSATFIPATGKFSCECLVQMCIGPALDIELCEQPWATKKRRARWNTSSTKVLWKLQIRRNPLRRATEAPMADHYNLLMYYDGSPESRSALRRVTHLGYALAATVHVLSVVNIGSAVGSSLGYLSNMACLQIEGTAREILNEALDLLRESGTVARGYVAVGNVVDSMARYAGLLNADLLVLGHRNPRGLAKWWGQPSNHVELVKRAAGRVVITVPFD
jgi:nucleotide-binding universal stress UspA family protein